MLFSFNLYPTRVFFTMQPDVSHKQLQHTLSTLTLSRMAPAFVSRPLLVPLQRGPTLLNSQNWLSFSWSRMGLQIKTKKKDRTSSLLLLLRFIILSPVFWLQVEPPWLQYRAVRNFIKTTRCPHQFAKSACISVASSGHVVHPTWDKSSENHSN